MRLLSSLAVWELMVPWACYEEGYCVGMVPLAPSFSEGQVVGGGGGSVVGTAK